MLLLSILQFKLFQKKLIYVINYFPGILVVFVTVILFGVRGDGTISFVDKNINVEESSGTATLKVQRTGGTSGDITFSCTVSIVVTIQPLYHIQDFLYKF